MTPLVLGVPQQQVFALGRGWGGGRKCSVNCYSDSHFIYIYTCAITRVHCLCNKGDLYLSRRASAFVSGQRLSEQNIEKARCGVRQGVERSSGGLFVALVFEIYLPVNAFNTLDFCTHLLLENQLVYFFFAII